MQVTLTDLEDKEKSKILDISHIGHWYKEEK
jgi:predicted transport protein